jgi:glycosyltransferase involved in cell wall biosynthesis
MMPVRTVVHFTDTLGFGGAEQMMLTTLAGLDRERWRPVLAHYPSEGAQAFAAAARGIGIATRVVPGSTGARGAAELPRFAGVLRSEGCAVLHAHLVGPLRGTKGLLAARAAGVPAVIATQHLYGELGSAHRRAKQRLVSRLVDRYIAVSRGMAEQLEAAVAIPGRVVFVHNAIETAAFHRPALDGSEPEVEAHPVVLALARLHRRKGIDHLLEAAARLPVADFLIAGDGPERPALEEQAARLGLGGRVRFLGTRTDVAELLRSSSIFVLPSLAEGLPVSVIEAMAAGRAVVATDIPGTNEIVVDGETGLLVPPRDPLALAGALGRLLGDTALRGEMGRAGRRRVDRHFSAGAMVRRIEALYEEVLDRGAVARSAA